MAMIETFGNGRGPAPIGKPTGGLEAKVDIRKTVQEANYNSRKIISALFNYYWGGYGKSLTSLLD